MGHDPVDPVTCVLFDLYGTLVDIRLNEDSPALWEGLAEAIRRRGGVVENPPEVRTRFHQFLHDEAAQRHVGFLMEPTSVFVGNSLVEDIEGARCVSACAPCISTRKPGVESLRADSSVLRVRPMGKALIRALEALGVRLH